MFALNAVLPIILLIALGFLIKKIKFVDDDFVVKANKILFNILLPVLLFINQYECERIFNIRWSFVLYALGCTVFMFLIGKIINKVFKINEEQQGAVTQCCFRTNFAIIGFPLALSLAGNEGLATAALLIFVIPLENVLSSISFNANIEENQVKLKKTMIDIIKNPLNIGLVIAIICLLIRELFLMYDIKFRLSDVQFVYTTLKNLSQLASPFALIVLGMQLNFSSIKKDVKPLSIATIFRLIVIPSVILFLTYFLFPSFEAKEYAAILALVASPVAVASAIIAKEMNGDENLAGEIVVTTTFGSVITLFVFIIFLSEIGIFV